jgi:hypothetical protein
MNISTLRTREKDASTPFGAAALNERSRLVTESANKPSSLPPNPVETTRQRQAEANSGETDPLIQALVERLPKSDSIWSIDDRAKWLKAAAMVFNLIYRTE